MTALYIILAAVVYIGLFFLTYTLMCIASDADAQAEREYADFMANRRTCPTCAHHLGGGQCRIHEEKGCAEGGGYELWQQKEDHHG
jgi:hypothetical protein